MTIPATVHVIWMYDHLGLYAWTVEIWCPQRQAGIKNHKPIDWYREHPFEDDEKMLAWSDAILDGKGYLPWKPFEHPQLGSIEIGGWDAMFAFRNPPPAFLEKEIAPLADWLVWHALISPRLEIFSAEVESLGNDAYLVRLVIDNTGWLPSYISKRALERKAVREVVAEIEIPEGVTLKTGKLRGEFGQLEGRAYKASMPYGWNADVTSERAKIEWTVMGPAGSKLKLTARHERAGTARAEITLS